MAVRDKRPWLRLLTEGAVIVASILLAFGIDAAWEARQEAERRAVVLEGLAGEFQAGRLHFDSIRTQWSLRRSAALRLLEVIREDGEPAGSQMVQDSLLDHIGTTPVADPVIGAVNAVLNSGDLVLLRSPELRSAIADWPREMESLTANQEMESRIFVDHMIPLLHRYVPYTDFDYRRGDAGFTGPSRFAPRYAELLGSLEFENWVEWRVNRSANVVARFDRLIERSDSVLAQLDRERGG